MPHSRPLRAIPCRKNRLSIQPDAAFRALGGKEKQRFTRTFATKSGATTPVRVPDTIRGRPHSRVDSAHESGAPSALPTRAVTDALARRLPPSRPTLP